MTKRVGIRREDKSIWERRAPIVPEDAKGLIEKDGLDIVVQPSDIRVFKEPEYEAVGATVQEDLSGCDVIFAVKEIPVDLLLPNKAYVFFAHVIKGQDYNMPMLQQLLDLNCTLIDYEKVTDENGRRLIFFGRQAGWAGMLDTLWALGRRLAWEGVATPLAEIGQALTYPDLESAKAAVQAAGKRIRTEGLPEDLCPLVVGFAGYGNVSQGAQDIFDLLPFEDVAPSDLPQLFKQEVDPYTLHKVVFKEKDMVEPIAPDATFELQDYYDHPEKYRGRFETYLPYLTALVNGIYWEEKYPRLATKAQLNELFSGLSRPRLRVIGDISCDVEGAVQCTVRCTEPGDPIYVYNPISEETIAGATGEGVVILAVDILPSELPRESSLYFSGVLRKYVPTIAQADYSASFEKLDLPPAIKGAVIAHRGELTPDYRYLNEKL